MTKKKNFLVLTGPAETGKTYISAALCDWVVASFDTYRIYKEYTLHKKIKSGFEYNWDQTDTLERSIDDQLIMIDDIGQHKDTEWAESILYQTLNIRYEKEVPTIITTNLSKQDFYDRYEHRIGSRLFAAENHVIDTTGFPNYRQLGY